MVLPLAGGSWTRRAAYSLNPQLCWESARSFLSTSSGTRIGWQRSFPNSSELRYNFNWTSLTYGVPIESLRRSLEVFNTNTGETTVHMGWWRLVSILKHGKSEDSLTKNPYGHDNERKRLQSAGAKRRSRWVWKPGRATVRRRDLTHSLSLSLVASCHR